MTWGGCAGIEALIIGSLKLIAIAWRSRPAHVREPKGLPELPSPSPNDMESVPSAGSISSSTLQASSLSLHSCLGEADLVAALSLMMAEVGNALWKMHRFAGMDAVTGRAL